MKILINLNLENNNQSSFQKLIDINPKGNVNERGTKSEDTDTWVESCGKILSPHAVRRLDFYRIASSHYRSLVQTEESVALRRKYY